MPDDKNPGRGKRTSGPSSSSKQKRQGGAVKKSHGKGSASRPTKGMSGKYSSEKSAGARKDQNQRAEKKEGKGSRNSSSTQKSYSKPGKGRDKSAESESIRLNKYIAHAGICSRREADKLIEAGLVSVNGKIVSEVGTKVNPEDDVRYNGERLGNERKVYLLLNKPKDYVTTVDDPHAKKTVMDLVRRACKERIYPVGRLDKNTTGVLLFTNDGELTRKLTHPSFNKKKIYHVFLNKSLQHEDLRKIAEGIELDDGFIQVDAIAYSSKETKKEVGLEIHSGRNRIVRRIFEHLEYKVTKLDRVYFAGLTKKNLPRGRWRFLTENEIKMLKMNAFE
jgi:23S rRNA pseudouridine2605 synthase